MVLLRLLTVLGFTAVLAGCNVSDDAKQLNNKVEMVKNDIAHFKEDIALIKKAVVLIGHLQQPCKPPGKHSDITCHYNLEILKFMGNSQYQARVPDPVIVQQNDLCRNAKDNPDHDLCVSYGDTQPYTFTIDDTTTYKVGDVVECTNDPKTDHLKCSVAQQMMKKT